MIVLTSAAPPDHKRVAELHAQNWRRHYRGILSDAFLDQAVDEYMFNTWLNKLQCPYPNQYTILASEDNQLLGFACLFLDDDEKYGSMLDNLHVAGHAQNKGIGKLLMDACAREVLDKARSKKMYLWVYEQNTSAINFYEKSGGFHDETVIKDTAEGNPAVVFRYAWPDASVLKLGK